MNRLRIQTVIRLLASITVLLVVPLGVGCDDMSTSDESDGHAGHDHAYQDDHDDALPDEPSAAAILAAHKHAEAGETCFMCDESKREQGRLWCSEHVRYEDRCWLCQPQLEDPDRPYCAEHYLYEDECHLCNAESAENASHHRHEGEDDHAVQGSAHEERDGRLWCKEHNLFEDECGICQPQLARSLKPGENLKVRFPSSESAAKAGVDVARPEAGQSAPSIEAICEVQYNLNAVARVTPLANGVIRKVHRDVGDEVEAGQVLVELHSTQVATAKGDYLAALVQREIGEQAVTRQERLRSQSIAADKDVFEAQALLRSASLQASSLRQRLLNLGFTEDEIATVEEQQEASARLMVRAPFAGTLVERDAVNGESVETGEPLFTVADLSSRWLMLSVPARYVAKIKRGQSVVARFDDLPGVEVRGEITWIDTSIDPKSRLVKARAVVTADANQVKTGLFGRARIMTGDIKPAALVPRDSIQQHAGGSFVFVQDEADLFSLRRVALGQTSGETIEVLAGLDPSDAVVTHGSFVVMSEFLKSRLGAGCADH